MAQILKAHIPCLTRTCSWVPIIPYTVNPRYLDSDYLEEKIWSLFYHRNLKSGYKILWKRGEIAPGEQFLPFPQYFQYTFLTKRVKLQSQL